MVFRVLQFLLGVLLAGGGGYLGWTERAGAANLFPPGPSGLPILLLAALLALTAGLVFIVSAVHPRPNQKRRATEKADRDETALGEAEAYYSERSRAADRDWRSGDIAPLPQPATPPPPPTAAPIPAQVSLPPAAVAPQPPPPPPPPRPIVAPSPPPAAPVPPPRPLAQPSAPAAVTPPPESRAVVTPPPPLSAAPVPPPPPPANPFPSPVTLSPIPRGVEVPPVPTPAPTAVVDGPYGAIRTAIAAGKLAEAEQMLNAARETAAGLELAELTAIAGEHAEAGGQQSHARWLWRLAMKRFGELDAASSPAALRVAAKLGRPA